MKVVITTHVPDDLVDPEHSTGLTEQGHEFLTEPLMELGFEDIVVSRADGWQNRTSDEDDG